MVASLKTNVPAVTTVLHVSGSDALKAVVAAGKGVGTAAFALVASCVALFMNANMLRTDKDADFLSRGDVSKLIKAELIRSRNMHVRQIENYLAFARDIYGKVNPSDRKSAFPAFVQDVAKAADATKAATIVQAWIETGFKCTTMNELGKKLGYSTGNNPAGAKTATERVNQLVSTVTNLEKAVETGDLKGKASHAAVAKGIANAVSDPLSLAREAIIRASKSDTIDTDDLLALIKLIETQVDAIIARAEKKPAKVVTKRKAKTTTKAATA